MEFQDRPNRLGDSVEPVVSFHRVPEFCLNGKIEIGTNIHLSWLDIEIMQKQIKAYVRNVW